MQQLQRELKTANELNTKLLQEQEECEQEIESVVRTNTSLKAQLATQDVEFEDMQGQRDELQAIVDRFKQCQEIHEQALQRIQDLEQQLEESEAKMTCKYCSGQARPTDNNLSIFAELNSFELDFVHNETVCSPIVESLTSPVKCPANEVNKISMKGSNKIKKYLKLSRFIRKSKLLLKRHNLVFKKFHSKLSNLALSDELLICQHQLDQTVEELNHRSNEIRKLELKLKDLNNKEELSSKALQEYIAFMNDVLVPGSGYPLRMESPRPTTRPVEPESPALRAALAAPGTPSLRALFAKRLSLASEPRRDREPAVRTAASPPSRSRLAEPAPPPPPRAVESAPSPPSLAKLALALLTYVEPSPSPPATAPPPPPGAAPCRAPATAPAPPPRPRPRAARTVLYSDEAGVGLGALLAERLHHRVINDCHPGATVDRLIECISAGEFDCDSTLVVFIGNSVDCTKRDILKLSATLSKVDREEVAKIIICALPYRMSSKVNKRVFHYNSLLYNLALYSSTISYFDTNKFIDEFVMPYKKTYLPRRCLVECADLLAYNIKGSDVASTAFNNNMKRFNFSCPGSEGFEMKPSGDLNLN
ncbi:tropomyosin-1, isoforms 33/34-like [Leguminivora glycinivorella]|uniref:tropomyosin-1, isoforms 33/34-like n=1 Tax=Leguminivora glycinivorella TaxID=1035111 RepID=UPI00200D3481|nr:tropomyosin-1, isoforms 33/34-like [Leguminivora glycinivorella]